MHLLVRGVEAVPGAAGTSGLDPRRRDVGSVRYLQEECGWCESGRAALSAASAPPLLAFGLRRPGPCRRVSISPAGSLRTRLPRVIGLASLLLEPTAYGALWVPEVHVGPGMPPLFKPALERVTDPSSLAHRGGFSWP